MFFLLLVLGRAFPHMDASPCGATPPHALISGFFSTLIFTPVPVTVVSLTGQSMEITGSYLLVCVCGGGRALHTKAMNVLPTRSHLET